MRSRKISCRWDWGQWFGFLIRRTYEPDWAIILQRKYLYLRQWQLFAWTCRQDSMKFEWYKNWSLSLVNWPQNTYVIGWQMQNKFTSCPVWLSMAICFLIIPFSKSLILKVKSCSRKSLEKNLSSCFCTFWGMQTDCYLLNVIIWKYLKGLPQFPEDKIKVRLYQTQPPLSVSQKWSVIHFLCSFLITKAG